MPVQGPFVISTVPIILLDWWDSKDYGSLLFALQNLGATPCLLFIETSEDGLTPDDAENGASRLLTVPAGKGNSFEWGPRKTRRFFRLSAYTAVGTTSATWSMTARPS